MMFKKGIFFLIVIQCASFMQAAVITITQPGFYNFGQDIVFTPGAPNESAIEIKTSNVILDFNEHLVLQNPFVPFPGINGITIDPNLQNIKIRNGTVALVTGTGIAVGEGVTGILLENMVVSLCATRGIEFMGTAGNPIERGGLNNITVVDCCQGPVGDFGILLQHVKGIKVDNIIFDVNGSSNNNVSVFRFNSVSAGSFSNIINGRNIGNTQLRVFDFTELKDCLFERCFVGGNCAFGMDAEVIAFDFRIDGSSRNNIFRDCISFSNSATVLGGSMIGFGVRKGNDDNNFFDCTVVDNSAHRDCIGFLFENIRANLALQSVISNNVSEVGMSMGCFVSSCTDLNISDATINEEISLSSTAIGVEVINSFECFFKGNTVRKSQGLSNATSYGFRKAPAGSTFNNSFVNNTAIRNGIDNSLSDNQFNGIPGSAQTIVRDQNTNSVLRPLSNTGFI
jgi:hypothetical protein